MNPRDRHLRKEIAIILIVKLIAITALWWAFIRDARVNVDVAETARHIGGHEPNTVTPTRQGALNAQ
nr:hypothetical protein [Dechloromonas sp.]